MDTWKRFAVRRQPTPIVRFRPKSRVCGADVRNLAKAVDRTTLSLELFAEFSCYRLERKAPVDAFLSEMLLRRSDIALRDHDKAVPFQGETTSKERRGHLHLSQGENKCRLRR
jgi:hypothetical protein